MKPIRVIQTGDFHMDRAFTGGRLTSKQAALRRRDLRDTFSAVLDLAKQRDAQLLLVTGDLFEHHYATLQTIRFIRDAWAARPELQVLVSPGNHDPAVADSFYRHVNWSPNVHIFLQGELERLEFPQLNLDVYGFGWTQWQYRDGLGVDHVAVNPDRFNLLMFHGEINGRSDSPYCPVPLADVAKAGFDYAAVGHIHQRQDHVSGGKILARYAGSPEPLHFAETGCHGVLYGEVSQANQQWEPADLARRTYRTVSLDAACLASQSALQSCLQEKHIQMGDRVLLRIDVEGPRSPDAGMDLEGLTDWLNEVCCYAEIRDRSYLEYDLDALSKEYEDTVLGDFIQAMKMKMEGAAEDAMPLLRKALQYGLDALFTQRGDFQ